MTKRLGLYPGTFDPPHPGHFAFTMKAQRDLHLDRVIFLPEPRPIAKPTATDLATRLQRLRDATSSIPTFEVAALPDDHFTVARTWPRLADMAGDTEVTLLLGSDKVASLAAWPDIEQLLTQVSLAIGLRDPHTERAITAALDSLRDSLNISFAYTIIRTDQAHIASSQLRPRHTQK